MTGTQKEQNEQTDSYSRAAQRGKIHAVQPLDADKARAIVDDTAGTTRDRQYGKVDWNGQEFSIVDTGGWVVNSDDVFWRRKSTSRWR